MSKIPESIRSVALLCAIILFAAQICGCATDGPAGGSGDGGSDAAASNSAEASGGAAEMAAEPISEMRDGMLGTVVTVAVYGDISAADMDAAFDAVREVDEKMSANRTDSELARINEDGYSAPVTASPETYSVVEKALAISAFSDDAFDPALGGLTALWKEDGAFARLPDDGEIASALSDAGADKVILADGAIAFETSGTRLDLGAIAKGYACDRAVFCLREAGVTSALVDVGGNLYAMGAKPGADAWVVGIRTPFPGEGGVACSVSVHDTSVVTSGGYQKFFTENGLTYHHILDPNTGYPANSKLLSVTVVCQDSATADALSTACFVLGLDRGLELLERRADAEGVFITDGLEIRVTSGLRGKVEAMDERFSLETV